MAAAKDLLDKGKADELFAEKQREPAFIKSLSDDHVEWFLSRFSP